MISFDPLWIMLKEKNISTYDLEYIYDLNPAEISRMKHNHNFTLKFISRLCNIFDCQPNDIIVYLDDDVDEQ